MSSTVALIMLEGRLARNAELKYTSQAEPLVTFTVVTDSPKKDRDGDWTSEPSFWDATYKAQGAEQLTQYLVKGKEVLCSGLARIDQWERDGTKHQKVRVTVSFLQLKGGGGKREQTEGVPV